MNGICKDCGNPIEWKGVRPVPKDFGTDKTHGCIHRRNGSTATTNNKTHKPKTGRKQTKYHAPYRTTLGL